MSTGRSAAAALMAAIPAVLGLAILVVHARLAHSLNVNWDEFNFLTKIHSHARGELGSRLLTFHVHLFSWVPATSPNEVTQVLRIRDVMVVLNVVDAVATFIIGRKLIGSVAGACFAVFAGQSFSFVLNHATSARYDPIVLCCFLVAAALLLSEQRKAQVAAGVVVAVGMLVSVKSVFYLPTLTVILACRILGSTDRRAAIRASIGFVVVAAVALALLFAWHATSLAQLTGVAAGASSTLDGVGGLASKMLKPSSGFTRLGVFRDTLKWDLAFWVLLVAGAVVAVLGLRPGQPLQRRLESAQLLAFALPLVALLFYRNTFAYFYVSIVPASALLIGLLIGRVEQGLARLPMLALVLIGLLAAPLARSSWLWWSFNSDDQIATQLQVVDVVHDTFPEPVPYVDRCGMISSFPKVGPFMSTFTLYNYRRRSTPIFAELLQQQQPQFLLQNIVSLELRRRFGSGTRAHRLLPEDFAVLQQSFIPHWGPLWVAGKSLAIKANAPVEFELVIPGRYRVEAGGDVVVDDQPVSAGGVVDLALGTHRVVSSVAGELTLRIASARPPPSIPAPARLVFAGFRYRDAPIDDDDETP